MKRNWLTFFVVLVTLAACAGPSWRDTNLRPPAGGAVPRDQNGNPVLTPPGDSGAAR